MTDRRRCPMCGTDLSSRRADAITCGASCRRWRERVLRLANGLGDGPYGTFQEYDDRPRRGVHKPAHATSITGRLFSDNQSGAAVRKHPAPGSRRDAP